MSSDQRYQSQIFNVILRQSRELTDQWQRNVRQAKVASFWGMQMAVYPVYLLFQVTRLSEQVLRQADTQGQRLLKAALDPDQSPLQGAQSDLPIRRVLEAIQIVTASVEAEDAQFVVEITAPSAQRSSLLQRYRRWFRRLSQRRSLHPKNHDGSMLRGLATNIESRHLILVTPANEPLDVLTPAQQKTLLQLMTWEVAHYQRQQRLNQQLWSVTKLKQKPLKQPVMRSQMLPPVRGFRKVMGWFQTSPMATTTNLFQEAKAADPLLVLMGGHEHIPLPDDLGAALKRLSPQVTPEAWEMMDVAIASLEAKSQQLMGPTTERLAQQITQQLRNHSPHVRSSPDLNPPTPAVQATGWLQSAFATLFGSGPVSPRSSATVAPTVSEPSVFEAGLSWNELYGAKVLQTSPPSATKDASPVSLESSAGDVLVASDLAGRVTIDEQGIEIEVDAVFVEYEQHSLERILNTLDRVVSWLEKRLIPWFEQSWSVVKVYFQKLGQP
ncbi:hypothetical protein C1752_00673 [Acaryochloris thomasi RCC1774]|uniref:Uncharacterized protein n=1 Tax=Acaryochloris thomasi RCC1774 TaxID=1764569 RepID=A0A2W1JMT4_9CYAN|nr:hypothetical protein [Acaryochloris thomasi]PZD74526.1 hypothetical protein C1752_00673 [Acaryochloris thomasi RCC1774]